MERFNELNIQKRGLVTAIFSYEDSYIDEGLRLYTQEQALHLYLKKNGYETIVFFNTANGFYSLELDMLARFLSEVNAPAETEQRPETIVEPSPAGHSSGRRTFGRKPRGGIDNSPVTSTNVSRMELNANPDPFGRYKTKSKDGGSRSANLREFDYNLRERKHCAIIVIAAESEPEFDLTMTQQLVSRLKDIEQHSILTNNDNRLLIIVPSDRCRENIMTAFDGMASVFIKGDYFLNKFTHVIETGTKTTNPDNTLVVPAPTQEVIMRAMELTRMNDGTNKEVDWENIKDICMQLSFTKDLTLKKVMSILQEKEKYAYDDFKAEGVKKRGNDMNSLNQLIGLQGVKDQIQNFINRIKLSKTQGKSIADISKHMVFYGNPGTGKTTVARIVAGILRDLGLLSKGHLVEVSREHLVAGYVGQTSIKTAGVIDSALDGVLFIDEAYRLADGGPQDFGRDAINTLLARIENDRERLAVILAGYEDDMNRLYAVNEGFKSRMKNYIYFEDYNAEELKQIFLLSARKQYTVPKEVDDLLTELMEHAVKYKEKKYRELEEEKANHPKQGNDQQETTERYKFANGRWVRNLFEMVEEKVAARQETSDITVLQKSDFEGLPIEELQGFVPGKRRADQEKQVDYMEELMKMIGLNSVKREVKVLVNDAQYEQMQRESGHAPAENEEPTGRHMVFSGNPGTGKTTVARLMAGIYHQLGLLPTKKLIEVDRSQLVAGFSGQTALKVKEVIERAMDGVLFIDEIYALVNDHNGQYDSFGHEALDTLVKGIEDNRDRIVVILAGYENLMRPFFANNPGLRSRFNTFIHFEDYTAEELEQILTQHLSKRGIAPTEEAILRLSQFIAEQKQRMTRDEGNGRWARNVCEKLLAAHKSHCVEIRQMSSELTLEEVERGISNFLQNQL